VTELPTGTVTFLFTDLEGSTRLWEQLPDAMRGALARHDEILRDAVEKRGGVVVKTTGDGLHAAFATAQDAIAAAVEAQRSLGEEPWELPDPLRVRMGVHTGEADLREGDYYGTTVNRAARVSAVAHGGQIVVSHATEELVRDHLPGEVALEDLGEHHLRDLARPERVFEVRASGLAAGFPPLRSLSSVRTNLPLSTTDLLGREEEVRALAALVADERLLTLAGPGGIGKTRLAMEVAAAVGGSFVDGVWFVDLAPVVEDDDVAGAVAAAMGAGGTVASEPALLGYLEQRRLLLVLDNCEHVIDGAASVLARLLVGAPDVHTIATSRELIDVQGEVVQWVAPLAVPEGSASADVAAAPAVQLFVARARAVRPDFAVDEANADDVAEICRRLDGVPLALELAAARVVSMSPHDIQERLGERFRLLAGGRRRQDRHRTLQAAVGWSYDLLDPDDQRVFRHLSVFGGSFDLVTAAAVVGGDEFEVADAVAGLAKRSLVGYDGGTGRYRLLETLRQFGADRLVEAGESESAQARLAAYFTEFAAAEGRRFDGNSKAMREHVQAEVDNLRAVAEWLAASGRSGDLVVMTRDLWQYLVQEVPAVGQAWIDPVVDRDELEDPQLRYDALWLSGALAIVVGDVDRALAMVERWGAMIESDPILTSPWQYHPEMLVAAHLGDRERLRPLCAEMRELAVQRDDRTATHFADCMAMLAMDGDDPDFEPHLAGLLDAAQASGNPFWLAATVSCASGPLMGLDALDDRERMLELLESHPGWEDAGQFYAVIIANVHARALTSRSAQDAARVALSGVRLGDQVGTELNLIFAMEALVLALAMMGLGPPAARLRGELLHGALRTVRPQPRLYALVDELLAEQGIGPAEPGPPLSRRELLDLLDEIEAALEKGPA